MKEVAAFLLGEASLDGYWFGERHPISPFWWRERLRAAQPATAPEQKPLVVMWAMYFRGYPEEPECKPAFMEDWRVYSDAASWDAEIDRANRNYQNHDNPTPGWLPYEARPVYVYAEAQPAIAPEPSWQDAPTCAGLWFCDEGDENPYRFTCHNVSIPLNPHLVGESERWYGPIPPDGDKP